MVDSAQAPATESVKTPIHASPETTAHDEKFVEVRAVEPLHPDTKKEISPLKMRRFVTHLSTAVGRVHEKNKQKNEIKSRIERIRQVSLNKRSTKQEIESELGNFEDVVREIIKDEEKILQEQRKGTRQVTELKGMVEMLSKKLIELGGDYAEELDSKDKKILELREALASANIKMSESGEGRAEKIKKIEEKVRAKADAPPSKEDLHAHLKELEKTHARLKKSGKHPKKKLDQLKRVIDRHKKTISEI